jgi:hypothetical protein
MTEPHVHCGQCYREIDLYKPSPLGQPVEVTVETGEQLVFAHGSSGPEVRPRRVPLCEACMNRLKAPSGLVVPTIKAVKNN